MSRLPPLFQIPPPHVLAVNQTTGNKTKYYNQGGGERESNGEAEHREAGSEGKAKTREKEKQSGVRRKREERWRNTGETGQGQTEQTD